MIKIITAQPLACMVFDQSMNQLIADIGFGVAIMPSRFNHLHSELNSILMTTDDSSWFTNALLEIEFEFATDNGETAMWKLLQARSRLRSRYLR